MRAIAAFVLSASGDQPIISDMRTVVSANRLLYHISQQDEFFGTDTKSHPRSKFLVTQLLRTIE